MMAALALVTDLTERGAADDANANGSALVVPIASLRYGQLATGQTGGGLGWD
jgi:hypothetical protein